MMKKSSESFPVEKLSFLDRFLTLWILLQKLGAGDLAVESAGVAPSRVRPEAVEAMREIGIDISRHRSKSVDEFAGQNFEYIITVCDNAKETCPLFPGRAIHVHHSFIDPPPETVGDFQSRMMIFRRVRDDLHEWLTDFARDIKP